MKAVKLNDIVRKTTRTLNYKKYLMVSHGSLIMDEQGVDDEIERLDDNQTYAGLFNYLELEDIDGSLEYFKMVEKFKEQNFVFTTEDIEQYDSIDKFLIEEAYKKGMVEEYYYQSMINMLDTLDNLIENEGVEIDEIVYNFVKGERYQLTSNEACYPIVLVKQL